MSGVRFEPFEFDQRTRSLRKRGVRLRVPDQSLTILEMLLQRPGEIVTREEIRDHLWPHGTIVEYEHSVNSAVQRLREALSDSASAPRYIETLAKRGYRFIAAVESAAAPLAIPNYRILGEIGRGAMGIVYRATDTRLGREVAVKVLRPDLDSGTRRKVDLIQEARAASTLNHPNIVTVHDVGTNNGLEFIVMEYIDGKPLRDLIGTRGMGVPEALGYAVQIADALSKAHAAGIVHLDLKPGNIMVTGGGLVKILDFGIARFTAMQSGGEEGMIAGTAGYMSPEQVQGLPVDARSDVFSLGCLLYEMLSGQRAFSSLYEIVHADPKPLPSAPPELNRILGLCLRKDRAERFQDIADLRLELEKLRTGSLTATGRMRPGRRVPLMRLVASNLAGGVVLAIIITGVFWWTRAQRAAVPPSTVRTFTGLPGLKTDPAFSLDGKQIAFVWDGDKRDNFDIYVQLLDESTPRRLTTDPGYDYSPAWSPDGLRIAFLRDTRTSTEVIVVPAAGGNELELNVSAAKCPGIGEPNSCGVAWSPDGKYLAFVDTEPPQPRSLFLLDTRTYEKRRLTNPPAGSWDGVCVFSPDGSRLAFVRRQDRPLGDIYVVALSGGATEAEPRRITHDYTLINGLDWSADGRSIIFSSTRGGVWALWQVSASGGEPERLAVGGNNAFWPAVARRGDRLAYSEGVADFNVWRVAGPAARGSNAPAAPVRITPSPQLDWDPMFSPDASRIAWASMHTGLGQIWVGNRDGKEQRPLTSVGPPGAAEPKWSPDGRQIAFHAYTRGPRHIYVIGANGGAPLLLTRGDFNEDLDGWSHDGKWIYFTSDHGEGTAIWKAPAGGGRPVLLVLNAWGATESTDGTFVYYNRRDNGIWRIPAAGGAPALVAPEGSGPAQSSDMKLVYYNGPDDAIWRVAVPGGIPERVLNKGARAQWMLWGDTIQVLDPDAPGGPALESFVAGGSRPMETLRLGGKPDDYRSGVDISTDGRWILFVRVDRDEQDIMMVENFR